MDTEQLSAKTSVAGCETRETISRYCMMLQPEKAEPQIQKSRLNVHLRVRVNSIAERTHMAIYTKNMMMFCCCWSSSPVLYLRPMLSRLIEMKIVMR